jgi:hypothetical protein
MAWDDIVLRVKTELPIRSRVAFVLAIAGNAIRHLPCPSRMRRVAIAALECAWAWEEGQTKTASQMYDEHAPQLAEEDSAPCDSQLACDALCTVVSAYFYMLWHAFGKDLDENVVAPGDVPNDIAEVSEDGIDEVCEFAVKANCAREYAERVAEYLIARVPASPTTSYGESVPRVALSDLAV